MKKYIMKCRQCGHIECLDFTDGDGAFIIPVKFAKTIQQVCKIYKQVTGTTYFEATGEKPSGHFHKRKMALSHLDIEGSSPEALNQHTFGKILCWTDL